MHNCSIASHQECRVARSGMHQVLTGQDLGIWCALSSLLACTGRVPQTSQEIACQALAQGKKLHEDRVLRPVSQQLGQALLHRLNRLIQQPRLWHARLLHVHQLWRACNRVQSSDLSSGERPPLGDLLSNSRQHVPHQKHARAGMI